MSRWRFGPGWSVVCGGCRARVRSKGFGVCVFADDHPDRAAEDCQAVEAGEGRPQDRQVLRVRHGRAAAAYGHVRAHRPLACLYMVRFFLFGNFVFFFFTVFMVTCVVGK